MFLHICLLLLAHVVAVSLSAPVPTETTPKLILISMDGFRHDYLEIVGKGVAPNFYKLMNAGVRASWVKNSYLTITLPNHFSLITGMYEGSHGVIDNVMFDRELNEKYDFFANGSDLEKNSRWFGAAGFPIWWANMANSRQWQPRGSAVLGWPGTPVRFRGLLPTHYTTWNVSLPWSSRVDACVQLLADNSQNINLVLLYFEEPDESGHKFGPLSDQVRDVIGRLDATLGYLMHLLQSYGLDRQVNIIVTSDHGMTTMYSQNVIDLSHHADSSLIESFSSYAYRVPNGSVDDVYKQLQHVQHLNVYRNTSVPARYHYTFERRMPDLIFMPQDGYYVSLKKPSSRVRTWGTHGFSNDYMDMWPFFVAYGPAFKKGYRSPPIENVDVYPLMCHILGIEPFANNGSFKRVADMLVAAHEAEAAEQATPQPQPPVAVLSGLLQPVDGEQVVLSVKWHVAVYRFQLEPFDVVLIFLVVLSMLTLARSL